MGAGERHERREETFRRHPASDRDGAFYDHRSTVGAACSSRPRHVGGVADWIEGPSRPNGENGDSHEPRRSPRPRDHEVQGRATEDGGRMADAVSDAHERYEETETAYPLPLKAASTVSFARPALSDAEEANRTSITTRRPHSTRSTASCGRTIHRSVSDHPSGTQEGAYCLGAKSP